MWRATTWLKQSFVGEFFPCPPTSSMPVPLPRPLLVHDPFSSRSRRRGQHARCGVLACKPYRGLVSEWCSSAVNLRPSPRRQTHKKNNSQVQYSSRCCISTFCLLGLKAASRVVSWGPLSKTLSPQIFDIAASLWKSSTSNLVYMKPVMQPYGGIFCFFLL